MSRSVTKGWGVEKDKILLEVFYERSLSFRFFRRTFFVLPVPINLYIKKEIPPSKFKMLVN